MSRTQRRHITAREGYDLWAPTYDAAGNPVVALDAKHSLRVLDPRPGELLLDAGFGTGRYLRSIAEAGARVVGIDFSHGMLAVARRASPNAQLAAVDLRSGLPFGDDHFDAVLCSLVGEHLPEIGGPLREFKRLIRPGGRAVFSVYHPEIAAMGVEANFEIAGVEYRLGAKPYSIQDYLDAFADAGFDEIAFASFRGAKASGKYEGRPLLFLVAATVAPD
jgi:SAM-dependent methyltransferase